MYNISYSTLNGRIKNGWSINRAIETPVAHKIGGMNLQTINERITLLRKDLELNQNSFATSIGVKQNTVSVMEKNGSTVTEQNIKAICSTFNINEKWLREGIEPMYKQLDRDEAIVEWAASLVKDEEDEMSEEMQYAKSFAEMLSKLSVDDWKVLAKMAKLMEEIKNS